MWDVANGQELQTFTGHSNSVNAVALTPDERRAVSASDDNMVKAWELETGAVIATFAMAQHTAVPIPMR